MSSELYRTRLYFDGTRPGMVRIGGTQRLLDQCPQIPGLPVIVGIDVAPDTRTWVLTPRHGPRRELEPSEVAAVKAWLVKVEGGYL